ncbi:unnamed protein product [Protopolystoma xenopodis]|uniref:Ion transport domain-containing protein n=1 Tax=Protopolystoma xenopodis TaxID=117903 RepID=A0A448XEE0_9PLAT|nr:unnamed protein product [Protopolystoma xenopodis]
MIRTTFVSKGGQVIYQPKAIALNYIRGWFCLDMIAAVPFDVILAVKRRELGEENINKVVGNITFVNIINSVHFK